VFITTNPPFLPVPGYATPSNLPRGFQRLVSRTIFPLRATQILGKGWVYLWLRIPPGVNPKPRFGPILDSTD